MLPLEIHNDLSVAWCRGQATVVLRKELRRAPGLKRTRSSDVQVEKRASKYWGGKPAMSTTRQRETKVAATGKKKTTNIKTTRW